jgi:hypothetical protein
MGTLGSKSLLPSSVGAGPVRSPLLRDFVLRIGEHLRIEASDCASVRIRNRYEQNIEGVDARRFQAEGVHVY